MSRALTVPLLSALMFALAGCSANLKDAVSSRSSSAAASLSSASVTESAGDVDTTGWIHYENKESGFALLHPSFYTVRENAKDKTVILESSEATITLKVVQSKISDQMSELFQPGVVSAEWVTPGWEVKDENVTGVVLRHFTGDARWMWLTYLFTKAANVPAPDAQTKTRPYDIIQAELEGTVPASSLSQDTQALQMSGGEQVLSTVRFTK